LAATKDCNLAEITIFDNFLVRYLKKGMVEICPFLLQVPFVVSITTTQLMGSR